MTAEQLALTDLHPCTVCNGTGRVRGYDGEAEDCPTCLGAGTLTFHLPAEGNPFAGMETQT